MPTCQTRRPARPAEPATCRLAGPADLPDAQPAREERHHRRRVAVLLACRRTTAALYGQVTATPEAGEFTALPRLRSAGPMGACPLAKWPMPAGEMCALSVANGGFGTAVPDVSAAVGPRLLPDDLFVRRRDEANVTGADRPVEHGADVRPVGSEAPPPAAFVRALQPAVGVSDEVGEVAGVALANRSTLWRQAAGSLVWCSCSSLYRRRVSNRR